MVQRRYHIMLAAAIFAVLMWVSINMGYDYIVIRQIPIVLENMKEGKALKVSVPKNVTVRFKGIGWLVAGLYLSPDLKYYIDLSLIGNDKFVITGRDLPEHVKLPVAVQPLDVKPETLVLALDDYKEKRVSIVPHIVVNCREGYGQVGPIHISPDSVAIGGSKEVVDQITQWPTVYQKLENLRTSVDMEFALEEPPNYSVELYVKTVRMRINIQPFAEKVFSGVPVNAIATPPNRDVIFIPPKMDVTVRGGIDQLAKLSNADFQVIIDYQSLLQETTRVITPILTVSEDVRVIGKRPERFQFIIRKRL